MNVAQRNNYIDAEQEFVEAFGGMWTRLGLSRTAGMILGALYLSDGSSGTSAGELAEILQVSRSTLSAALAELQSLNLIQPVHALGQRRELYRTFRDLTELSLAVFRVFKQRDVEILLKTAKASSERISSCKITDERRLQVRERVQKASEYFELVDRWLYRITLMSPEQYTNLLRLSDRILGILKK